MITDKITNKSFLSSALPCFLKDLSLFLTSESFCFFSFEMPAVLEDCVCVPEGSIITAADTVDDSITKKETKNKSDAYKKV